MLKESLSDEKLVEGYIKGDEQALEEIVRRYISTIYGFSRLYVGDLDKAADITQEVFVKAWRNIEKFDVKKNFKSWIFAIAKNTAIDWLRKSKDTPFSLLDGRLAEEIQLHDVSGSFSTEDLLDKRYAEEKVRLAVKELPEHYRQVVALHNEEQLTFREITEVLKEPVNTLKSRYRRALQLIKKGLGNAYPT